MSHFQELEVWIVVALEVAYVFVTEHVSQTFLVLLAIMTLNIVSGLMIGLQRRKLKSSIMSLGFIKKGAILLSILFAYLLDLLLNDAPVFETMMTWLAIGNEGLSFTENLNTIGVKVPRMITNSLHQIKELININLIENEKETKKKKM